MSEFNSLVPIVAEAAVKVSGSITNLITNAKANGIVRRSQLVMLKLQTEKVLADARIHHASELITTNLEQIAKTQEQIDNLEKQGKLHGKSLEMAMQHLEDLNLILRYNLRQYLKEI